MHCCMCFKEVLFLMGILYIVFFLQLKQHFSHSFFTIKSQKKCILLLIKMRILLLQLGISVQLSINPERIVSLTTET